MSIREEVYGLLRSIGGNVAAVLIIDSSLPEYRQMSKVRSALVVKIKAGHRFKSRLCVRGDEQSLLAVNFPSAPTMGREMIKVLLSCYVNNFSFVCGSVDISQAFIQADILSEKEQNITYPADNIVLDGPCWEGGIRM